MGKLPCNREDEQVEPMVLGEFDLIHSFFSSLGCVRNDVSLGIGDDCALLNLPEGMQLAATMDTLVAGVHFFPDVAPETLGHKALAVNLSDLAAMGAKPAWISLALTLPKADPDWLRAFSRGMGRLASRHEVQLIGGDTTQGPLSVTIQALGLLPRGSEMRRSGARVGDWICVTGTLGDAGLALHGLHRGQPVSPALIQRLERPEPRVEAGLALRELANSAIDISDGLLADLGHVLQASGVGGEVRLQSIPLSDQVREVVGREQDWSIPLASGDDYELCVTLPPQQAAQVEVVSQALHLPITRIGEIVDEAGLRCRLDDGTLWSPSKSGYNHFLSHA